jgi:hypothetical protein
MRLYQAALVPLTAISRGFCRIGDGDGDSMCSVLSTCKAGRCPSADNPQTVANETNCEGKASNGATAGAGQANNLCYVACGNQGVPHVRLTRFAARIVGEPLAAFASKDPVGAYVAFAVNETGLCDFNTGLCSCFKGWYGDNCVLKSALSKGGV